MRDPRSSLASRPRRTGWTSAATAAAVAAATVGAACATAPARPPATAPDAEPAARLDAIHARYVFADMHAHPSRFHRADLPRITKDEIALYQRERFDVVVANISTDAVYSGGYVNRDGTEVARGQHRPAPGFPFEFTADRLSRIMKTVADGDAAFAATPAAALEAKRRGKVALLPALEGGDGLDGRIENLWELHRRGLRLLQLVHFRANEIGHIQTYPYSPGGLTAFGREVVRECNRLGIIIDLAHANNETILDVLELSSAPVIFSHTGVKALHDGDRYLPDDEIRAIAAKDGVVGIWPNGSGVPRLEDMLRHIDHVVKLVGVEHVGIGSDLRGMSRYSIGFDSEARFHAIAAGLLDMGYTDDDVGRIMGGNFFRLWEAVTTIAEAHSPRATGVRALM